MNIWTHLIGFIIFLVLLIHDIFLVLPSWGKDSFAVMDILVLISMLVCFQERENIHIL
jgi:predicted membrane channel-forming protein YqfA (hemolysin III family)